MSGFGGGFLFAFLFYTLVVTGVCALLSLVTRKIFEGFALVSVTVLLAVAVTLVGFVSGMAKSDFTLWLTLPFLLAGLLIATVWTAILIKKAPGNG